MLNRQHRLDWETKRDILQACLTPTPISHVISKTNIWGKHERPFLKNLQEKGFLITTITRSLTSNKKCIMCSTTEEGEIILRHINDFLEMLQK